MAAKKKDSWGIPLGISVVSLVIIAVSLVVISGKFSSLITIFVRPHASAAQPVITDRFIDAFKDGKVNADKWDVSANEDVSVQETTADNLRVDIPGIPVSKKAVAKRGTLVFKEKFKKNADFRVTVIMYRPIINKDGAGQSGIAFSSASKLDDEAASIVWKVASDSGSVSSKIIFDVKAPNGDSMIHKEADLRSNIAVLQLTRVNGYYRGAYHPGADLTGDVEATVLGEIQNAELGDDGKVRILTNNAGTKTKVIGRFDTAYVYWQANNKPTPTSDQALFTDNFGDGVVNTKWTTHATSGSTTQENTEKNLAITVLAGAVDGKAGNVQITRNEPVVGTLKNFVFTAWVYKPSWVGGGLGAAGLRFQSSSAANKEAAHVSWRTGKDASGKLVSRLVFVVTDRTGKQVEVDGVNLKDGVIKVALQLRRTGTKYAAFYKLNPGDPDTAAVAIGSEKEASFGEDGRFGLFVSNLGQNGKYPFVAAQFDFARAVVKN